MIPVTKTTIPRTQKRPPHLVKSTWWEKPGVNQLRLRQPSPEEFPGTPISRSYSFLSHLRLEAEDGHGDADDYGDPQRQEHRLGVVVTGIKTGSRRWKKQHASRKWHAYKYTPILKHTPIFTHKKISVIDVVFSAPPNTFRSITEKQ